MYLVVYKNRIAVIMQPADDRSAASPHWLPSSSIAQSLRFLPRPVHGENPSALRLPPSPAFMQPTPGHIDYANHRPLETQSPAPSLGSMGLGIGLSLSSD